MKSGYRTTSKSGRKCKSLFDINNAEGEDFVQTSGDLNRVHLIAEVKGFELKTLVEVKAMSIFPLKTRVKTDVLALHFSRMLLNP